MLFHIVKRSGKKEYFDSRKIHTSVMAACLAVPLSKHQAELIADMVEHDVSVKISPDETVSTSYIHDLTYHELKKYQAEAAYLYNELKGRV